MSLLSLGNQLVRLRSIYRYIYCSIKKRNATLIFQGCYRSIAIVIISPDFDFLHSLVYMIKLCKIFIDVWV